MSEPSPMANGFREQVQKLADEVGIDTMFLMIRDPDTHMNLSSAKGDSLWVIGALHAKAADMIKDYNSQTEEE